MFEHAGDKLTEAQELLELGFQRCLELTEDLQRQLREEVERKAGPLAFFDSDIRLHFRSFSERLYRKMAETLFELILVLQREDCGSEPVNFYFWPGYHSYLIDKRIFIRNNGWNFGVGIYKSAKADPYYDCSQARWFHYLIRHPKSKIAPIDIHQQFREQSAAQNSTRLSSSLIVSTEPVDQSGSREDILELPPATAGTEGWGKLLMEKLNRGLGHQSKSSEDGPFTSLAKMRMHSLWLHAAFCGEEPPWLQRFIKELKTQKKTEGAALSLENGLNDKIATDWGDQSRKRPIFRSWVNLSLRTWLNPLGISLDDDPSWTSESDKAAQKTVGSAGLLCSVPIRPQYLAFARAWVSEVYNTVRNAEMAIIFHNQQLALKEASMAGPFFAHEIQRVIDQSLLTVQRNFADNGQEAVETRRYVLYSIRTLCNLAYSFTNAILSNNKNALETNKKGFVDPLRNLRAKGTLVDDITCIAREIYKSVKRPDGATVVFRGAGEMKAPLHETEHGVCFLLTAEMLRNFCQSQDAKYEAEFQSSLDKDILIIKLTGQTGAGRTPVSMTLTRIDRFLRTLDAGRACINWDHKTGQFTSTVTVNLKSTTLPSASVPSN